MPDGARRARLPGCNVRLSRQPYDRVDSASMSSFTARRSTLADIMTSSPDSRAARKRSDIESGCSGRMLGGVLDPTQGLSRMARDSNPRRPGGATERNRRADRAVALRSPRGGGGPLSRSRKTSGSRGGDACVVRIWRDGESRVGDRPTRARPDSPTGCGSSSWRRALAELRVWPISRSPTRTPR